ncbi:MAG TPA: hypothetical protein VFW95_06760 [Candidatus Limnocylindria bacterium]|nr:hypothetical protein [Candidatus Limnocylindria bacterium]
MKRRVLAVVLAATAAVVLAAPTAATVHEITGKFCSGGHGNEFPPGLSGGSSADNFAQPLFATGLVESVEPFAGDGVNGPGVLITIDFDNPASKLAPHPTLDVFFLGEGTYVSAFVLDGPYTNCAELRDS